MLSISKIMNPDVASVRPDNVLTDVVKILTEKKISGVPVVDEGNRVVGIISDRDLLVFSQRDPDLTIAGFSTWATPYMFIPPSMPLEGDKNFFAETRVDEVMSKRVVVIKENEPWENAVMLMKKNSVNRLPVVDQKGVLKGIVARTDLLNYLAEERK